jgi:hypothetical protein
MANITPWNQPSEALQRIQDDTLLALAANKREAMEVWQKINYGVGLYEYAVSRIVPLHLQVQSLIEQRPELEPLLGDLTYGLASAIKTRVQSYIGGSGFDDQTPSWLR